MKSPLIRNRPRPAFTIIELLVALALVLFIMSIISQVFVDTSEAFRSQRAKAELSEKLRFITQTLRADLRANHFENNRRLSDDDFWDDGPPKIGYFRLEQAEAYLEVPSLTGNDTALISKKDSGTVLAFTNFLQGNEQRGFHSVTYPVDNFYDKTFGTYYRFSDFNNWKNLNLASGDTRFEGSAASYNSPSAEIAWFVAPTRSPLPVVLQDEPDSPNIQLFKLYRKVLPILPQNPLYGDFKDLSNSSPLEISSHNYERIVSAIPNQPSTVFNSAFSEDKANVDVPMRRGIGTYLRDDPRNVASWHNSKFDFSSKGKVDKDYFLDNYLIAENVLSFTVEVLPKYSTKFVPLINKKSNPVEGGIFDTWCARKKTDTFYPATTPPIVFSSPDSVLNFNEKWNDISSSNDLTTPLSSYKEDGSWFWNGTRKLPHFTAIRVTIRLYDTNNALSPSKTTWQATVVEQL